MTVVILVLRNNGLDRSSLIRLKRHRFAVASFKIQRPYYCLCVFPHPLFTLALLREISRKSTLIGNGSYKALHYPTPLDPPGSCTKAMSLFENTPEENTLRENQLDNRISSDDIGEIERK
uniref:Uncharacterized protein n=1 Tax=Megaselia scalaris TaxID=36166 RepID=T1H0E3_MEGSC